MAHRSRSNTLPTKLPSSLQQRKSPRNDSKPQAKTQAFETVVPINDFKSIRSGSGTKSSTSSLEEELAEAEQGNYKENNRKPEQITISDMVKNINDKQEQNLKQIQQSETEMDHFDQPQSKQMVDRGKFYTVFAEGPIIKNQKEEDSALPDVDIGESAAAKNKTFSNGRFSFYGEDRQPRGEKAYQEVFRPRAFSESQALPAIKPGKNFRGPRNKDNSEKEPEAELEPIINIFKRGINKAEVTEYMASLANTNTKKNSKWKTYAEREKEQQAWGIGSERHGESRAPPEDTASDFRFGSNIAPDPRRCVSSSPTPAELKTLHDAGDTGNDLHSINFRPHAGKPTPENLVDAGFLSGNGSLTGKSGGGGHDTSGSGLEHLNAETANRLLNSEEKLPALRTGIDLPPPLQSILKSPSSTASLIPERGGLPSDTPAFPPPVPIISVSFHDPENRYKERNNRRLHINPVTSVHEYNIGHYLSEDSESDESVTSLVSSFKPEGNSTEIQKKPLPRGSDVLNSVMEQFWPQEEEELEVKEPEVETGSSDDVTIAEEQQQVPLKTQEPISNKFRIFSIGNVWAKGVRAEFK